LLLPTGIANGYKCHLAMLMDARSTASPPFAASQ